ncbi:MAG: peptidylprolyl isomerase [Planctomycetota bacterium]
MLTALLLLLPLAQPVVEVPKGPAIKFDGTVEDQEWAGAYALRRSIGDNEHVELKLRRQGRYLAVGVRANREYRGEAVHLSVSDAAGSWICSLYMTAGRPAMPPLLWRRGPSHVMASPGPAECPRGGRARASVGGADSWSTEYLVRLATLGIGRGDRRGLRIRIHLYRSEPTANVDYIMYPAEAKGGLDTQFYAQLVSKDNWGAGESWPPIGDDESREYDDHELLLRLHREHARMTQRLEPEELVIFSAVQPRSMSRISLLRGQIEAARERNPTLPAYTYFLGRLLQEANLFAEAAKVIASVPAPLARLAPFTNLAAEHYNDLEQPEKAYALLKDRGDVPRVHETIEICRRTKKALEEEKKALEEDAKKSEANPRIKIVTPRGEIVCELFEDDAPLAVRNFVNLILRNKFYDGLRFRPVGGGLVTVGDPRTRKGAQTKLDNPGWRLKPEPRKRPLLRGRLATVPAPGDTFNGSQFVILAVPLLVEERLVVFGRVVSGLEIVEQLEDEDPVTRIEIVSKRNHAYDPLDGRQR